MKKLLFSAYSLDIGGIEKALVTLVNNLQKNKYKITVALEKKQGIFLEELNPEIEVVEYNPSENKIVLIRKISNFIKRVKFILRYKNKFDFSASFATYSIPSSFMSRTASKNCCLWGHADYFTLFNGNIKEMKEFFIKRKYDKFKHIIFVSEEGKKSFENVFPESRKKLLVCNNLIDGDKIIELAKDDNQLVDTEELIEKNKKQKLLTNNEKNVDNSSSKNDEKVVYFINVGRHDEKQKKLSRIIEASAKLKDENYKFRVLLVGDGPDTDKYKKQIKEKQLQENVLILGKKKNPYPYFKISDCVILSSDYEGFPVVFLESLVLEKPIITTKVSDYKKIEGRYGYIAEKTSEDIYLKMKLFIEQGFNITEKFDYKKYNEEILNKLKEIF